MKGSELNENELDESADSSRIDEMIDQIIARDGSTAPADADEALVRELSGLGPIEWRADKSGERIALMMTSRVDPRQRGERGRPVARPRRSRWVVAGAAAAAALVPGGGGGAGGPVASRPIQRKRGDDQSRIRQSRRPRHDRLGIGQPYRPRHDRYHGPAVGHGDAPGGFEEVLSARGGGEQ
jgi:hypothetical protein